MSVEKSYQISIDSIHKFRKFLIDDYLYNCDEFEKDLLNDELFKVGYYGVDSNNDKKISDLNRNHNDFQNVSKNEILSNSNS